MFSGERLSSETENEAKDYLVDLLASRIYDVDCGVGYEDFKNALLRMSETTVMLSKFKSKEDAVEYLAKETGLTPMEIDGSVSFEESEIVIVLKKVAYQDIKPEGFIDETIDEKCYPDKDYHRMYIGEVVSCYIR